MRGDLVWYRELRWRWDRYYATVPGAEDAPAPVAWSGITVVVSSRKSSFRSTEDRIDASPPISEAEKHPVFRRLHHQVGNQHAVDQPAELPILPPVARIEIRPPAALEYLSLVALPDRADELIEPLCRRGVIPAMTPLVRHVAIDDGALSVQVLQEFNVQATRPTRPHPLTHETAVGLVSAWRRFKVQEITLSILTGALEIKAAHGFSYWDSAIISAACALGCREVYSEDMSHGRELEGITIVNPFR